MRMTGLALLLATVSWAQEAPPPPPEGAAPPAVEATLAAEATSYAYWGYHPVPPSYGSFCVLTGLHEHPYAPYDATLFVVQDGYWVFVGDPYPFGYSGGVYLYSGHHPHSWGGWCYHDGHHQHLFAPFGSFFVLHGHHHMFHGPHDGNYWRHHPRHMDHDDRTRPSAHAPALPRRHAVPRPATRPSNAVAPPARPAPPPRHEAAGPPARPVRVIAQPAHRSAPPPRHEAAGPPARPVRTIAPPAPARRGQGRRP